MAKFKVGDEVIRTASHDHDYMYMESGKGYTVSQVFGREEDECIYVDNYQHYWDADYFELYRPEQLEPTELDEALAKIDTLESALEDAVRELISLREGNNTVFKPINEMTLEDWEIALEEGAVFETREGEQIHILFMKPCDRTPYTFTGSNGYNYTYWGSIWESSDDEEDIIKRIK